MKTLAFFISGLDEEFVSNPSSHRRTGGPGEGVGVVGRQRGVQAVQLEDPREGQRRVPQKVLGAGANHLIPPPS